MHGHADEPVVGVVEFGWFHAYTVCAEATRFPCPCVFVGIDDGVFQNLTGGFAESMCERHFDSVLRSDNGSGGFLDGEVAQLDCSRIAFLAESMESEEIFAVGRHGEVLLFFDEYLVVVFYREDRYQCRCHCFCGGIGAHAYFKQIFCSFESHVCFKRQLVVLARLELHWYGDEPVVAGFDAVGVRRHADAIRRKASGFPCASVAIGVDNGVVGDFAIFTERVRERNSDGFGCRLAEHGSGTLLCHGTFDCRNKGFHFRRGRPLRQRGKNCRRCQSEHCCDEQMFFHFMTDF